MDRVRSYFQKDAEEQEYQPLLEDEVGADVDDDGDESQQQQIGHGDGVPFSWVEYGIFCLLGVAMLWAWNMFLAAAPYFQRRFEDDKAIYENFQSGIISVSTIVNLTVMAVLTKKQSNASYPFRIKTALYMNAVCFALLTVSTVTFLDASPTQYLVFVLLVVSGAAWAAGMMQNGAFAFVASFGRPEYMQAIMAGQAVAGVLPPLAQIVSVLVAPPSPSLKESRSLDATELEEVDAGKAAFIYFSAAVAMSLLTILAFVPLVRRHDRIVAAHLPDSLAASVTSIDQAERAARKVVTMTTLLKKLRWLAAGVFLCFSITMFFPVFTTKIVSVAQPENASPLLRPEVFIPLAMFFWNLGDLGGRAGSLIVPCRERPVLLFVFSVARVVFLPMYALCNIHGKGALIASDLFYLVIVQFPYGLTNGWLASNCMMAAGQWVDEGEREAAGGFMGLCLTGGLAFGSLLSFTAAGI